MVHIISRKDAKAQGLMFYFTGKPCAHGHISDKRYVGDCNCFKCAALKEKPAYCRRKENSLLGNEMMTQRRWAESCHKGHQQKEYHKEYTVH